MENYIIGGLIILFFLVVIFIMRIFILRQRKIAQTPKTKTIQQGYDEAVNKFRTDANMSKEEAEEITTALKDEFVAGFGGVKDEDEKKSSCAAGRDPPCKKGFLSGKTLMEIRVAILTLKH